MFNCPPNSDWPDGFPAGLSSAENFVVTELRLWAAPYKDANGPHADWRAGFEAVGVEEAQEPFDALFRIVVASADRALDVRCPRCTHLGEDEGVFLRMVGLAQRHRWTETEALLAAWLPAEVTHAALAQSVLFASALAAAGLMVPLRGGTPGTDKIVRFPNMMAESASMH